MSDIDRYQQPRGNSEAAKNVLLKAMKTKNYNRQNKEIDKTMWHTVSMTPRASIVSID